MKQRKEMSKALFNKRQSLSFDSGMSSRLHTSADNGHPETAETHAPSPMALHAQNPRKVYRRALSYKF